MIAPAPELLSSRLTPPPGFDGYESCKWDGLVWYERACTPEEADLLDANQAAGEAEERADHTAYAEAERDGFFERLSAELNRHPGLGSRQSTTLMGSLDPGPAFSPLPQRQSHPGSSMS